MPFPWQNPQFQTPNSPTDPKPYKNPFFLKSLNPLKPLLSNQTATSFKTQLENLTNQAKRALHLGFSTLLPPPNPTPFLARITPLLGARGMPEAVDERLSGVPVYALSNAAEEFVLVSGVRTRRSLGLVCFKKEDAEALLDTMKSMNRDSSDGSRVVAVALSKVLQLKVDGVAFRLIPDPDQILNATKLKESSGEAGGGFLGVPVFQSRTLTLKSQGKCYRPAFFRKEDLEDSLLKASSAQGKLNPSLRKGNIEVSSVLSACWFGIGALKLKDKVFSCLSCASVSNSNFKAPIPSNQMDLEGSARLYRIEDQKLESKVIFK